LRRFSDLLQLRPAAIHTYLDDGSTARALRLFVVVSLIAGLGLWFSAPRLLQQPTPPEQVDQAAAATVEAAQQVVATTLPFLIEAQRTAQTVVGTVRQWVTTVTGWVNNTLGGLSAALQTGADLLTSNAVVQFLLLQSQISRAQIEAAISQVPLTTDELGQLLARADLTPEQTAALLQRAGLDAEQIQQVQTVRTQTSTVLTQISSLIGLAAQAPEALRTLIAQVEATPAELRQLAADVRAEAVAAEPPLGTRPSRIVRLGGEWLSTPLRLANDWLLFALVLLVVVKLLGGRAPLPKHLGAMALAAAPLVLAVGLYLPNLDSTLSIAMSGAVHYYTRILAAIGLLWAALLLLRCLSVVHEISLWRAAGAVALTWLTLYVLLPLAALLISGYLLV
jgi:hypothetical protein